MTDNIEILFDKLKQLLQYKIPKNEKKIKLNSGVTNIYIKTNIVQIEGNKDDPLKIINKDDPLKIIKDDPLNIVNNQKNEIASVSTSYNKHDRSDSSVDKPNSISNTSSSKERTSTCSDVNVVDERNIESMQIPDSFFIMK